MNDRLRPCPCNSGKRFKHCHGLITEQHDNGNISRDKPDMDFPLQGPKLKIERAHTHLVNLERTEREFFNNESPAIIFEDDIQAGYKLAKIKLDAPIPEDICVLAGELIYQLRSSLDQIAVAFARMSTGKTSPKSVYFPTGDCSKGFEAACAINLAGFDEDLADQIIRTKAYDGGDNILRAIFRLGNIDKHFDLIPIGTSGSIKGISSYNFIGCSVFIDGRPQSLKEGILLARVRANGSIAPNHPNAQIRVTGRVALGKASIYEGKILIPFFSQLVHKATAVYNNFVLHCQHQDRFNKNLSFSKITSCPVITSSGFGEGGVFEQCSVTGTTIPF